MSELSPEPSTAIAGADPGRRKTAAHEVRGARSFALTSPPAATPIADAAVVASTALQYSAPVEPIRKALMREGQGRASGPLGGVLDLLMGETR